MQNPARVKAIFHELRAAGVDASARDLLRLAHLILQLHHAEAADGTAELHNIIDSRSLPMLPVDVAIGNWSWRVLEFELFRRQSDEMDPSIVNAVSRRLTNLLGSQWERSLPPG